MIDLRRNIISTYKSDTSDFKRGSEEMKRAVGDVARAEKDAAGEREKHSKSAIDGLAKLGMAYTGVSKLVTDLFSTMRDASERMRLENAAHGVSIAKLSDAAGGLITQHKQLEIAAKLNQSAYKLTEDQMITVEKAMRALVRQGFDQEEVTKKVTEAFVKLDDGALKDFGVKIKETHSDGEKHNEMLRKMSGLAAEVGDGHRTAAEETAALGVSFEDSMDSMKQSIGKLVIAMAPLLKALADAVAYIAKIAANAPKEAESKPGEVLGSFGGGAIGGLGGVLDYYGKRGFLDEDNLKREILDNVGYNGLGERAYGAYTRNEVISDEAQGVIESAKALQAAAKAWRAPDRRNKKWDGAGDSGVTRGYDATPQERDTTLHDLAAGLDTVAGMFTGADNEFALPEAPEVAETLAAVDQLSAAFDDMLDKTSQKLTEDADRESMLEKHFGKLEEFDAYATAFNMLSGAVGAALGAWIDGSESAGAAFKHFIGDSLKTLSIQMAIEALKEGAKALGDFAGGNPAGATLHGLAAAKYAAVAIAAAVAAKGLGTGASASASAGSGAGASSGGGRSSGSDSNGNGSSRSQVVIITDDSISGDTKRMKQIKARRMLALGFTQAGYNGVENS